MRKYRTLALSALLLVCAVIPGSAEPGKPPRSAWLTPGFSLTLQQLGAMTVGLPPDIRDRIVTRPAAFLDLMAEVLAEQPVYLILIDKRHPLGADYEPSDLVRLRDYPLSISRSDLSLRRSIMPEVVAMAAAARRDGVTLLFSSTYRSYATQRVVYEREVETYGREVADRESARPGSSQHQLGTVIDFGSITDEFAHTAQSRWLNEHAGEYGFSLSYPEGYEQVTGYRYESWHYRYITRPGARMQIEFFGGIQQYLLQFLHDNRAILEANRVAAGG